MEFDLSNITFETLLLDGAAIAALIVAWWGYKATLRRHTIAEAERKHKMEDHEKRIARLEGKDAEILEKIEDVGNELKNLGQSVARIEGILENRSKN